MIGIRSITYNLPEKYNLEVYNKIQRLNYDWKNSYPIIRTTRLNMVSEKCFDNLKKYECVEKDCLKLGIRWFNIPIDPWNEKEDRKAFSFAYDILKNYNRAFVHILGVKNKKININVIKKSSDLIYKVSKLGRNGHENFRLGISCNAVENTPFFPFTMSSGKMSFSIALELTQEINLIIKNNAKKNLEQLRKVIVEELEKQIYIIEKTAERISKENEVDFAGFDFSLAPVIEENGSVIPILEHIGIKEFGELGSLFATYYLTDILKSFGKRHRMVGFSGVMYSLLEDFELCKMNNENPIRIEHLIAMSTMCGCGLDMIPIYSDVTNDEIVTMILEVAAVSNRLNKPLGVRLLPIPNTYKGEKKSYTFFSEDADFVANTRVIDTSKNIIEYKDINYFEFLDRKN